MTIRFNKYKKIAQWLLISFCIFYIVLFFQRNSGNIKNLLTLDISSLVGLIFFCMLGSIIYSIRFQIVLTKCSGKSVPFFQWFRIVVLGRFLNTFIPQAGNIYRSTSLKKNHQISYTRYVSSFFAFTWIDTGLNLIITMGIVLAVDSQLKFAQFRILHLLAGLIVLIALAPILLDMLFRRIKFQNKYLSWVHDKLHLLFSTYVSSLSDGPYMFKVIITGLVAFIHAVTLFYFCFSSLHLKTDLPTLALFYVVLKLSNQIIITPGNLGVREVAYGILSRYLSIGMTQGILVSIVIRVIGTLVTITMGLLFGGFGLLSRYLLKHKSQQAD